MSKRKSCECPKKHDISPLKTQKTPEYDKDRKQKHYVPSPKATKPPVTGPQPPQRVNPPSQSQSKIKPSDSDNPIEAKPIESQMPKMLKVTLKYSNKVTNHPLINKRMMKMILTFKCSFVNQNWTIIAIMRVQLNKGTLVVHCFQLHETFQLQKQMWPKKVLIYDSINTIQLVLCMAIKLPNYNCLILLKGSWVM